MIKVKFINEGRIQDEAGRNPLSLFWVVTHPVHQILSALSPVANDQQVLDFVGRSAINHLWRWGGCEGRDHWTFLGGLDLTDVEGGMHSERQGKTEANSSSANDLGDGEGTHEPRSQLL